MKEPHPEGVLALPEASGEEVGRAHELRRPSLNASLISQKPVVKKSVVPMPKPMLKPACVKNTTVPPEAPRAPGKNRALDAPLLSQKPAVKKSAVPMLKPMLKAACVKKTTVPPEAQKAP